MVELVEYINKVNKKKESEINKYLKRMRTFLRMRHELDDFVVYSNHKDTRSMYVNTLSEEDTDSIWQAMYVDYGPGIDDSVFEGMRY